MNPVTATIRDILPDHLQRVFDERDELVAKLTKLAAFIDGKSNFYETLPPEEKRLLRQQFAHMHAYADVLNSRLRSAVMQRLIPSPPQISLEQPVSR